MRIVTTALAGLVLWGLGFYAGWGTGHEHPGKVLVPEKSGVPADLPFWACDEIVASRIELMTLRTVLRSEKREGGIVEHYATGGGACR